MDRRESLKFIAGAAGLLVVSACGSDKKGAIASSTSTTAPSSTSTSALSGDGAGCTTIPEETSGPFPGDGSNGPNALSESGIVRSDIRSSFGSSSGVADGVPLTIKLTVVDNGNGCAPRPGAAVYVWHCDRDGNYSMYSDGAPDENYLRGVQAAGSDGVVSFKSIYPGAYSGRWPHVHFEVYDSVADATGAGSPIATSQLAFPEDVCNVVYGSDGYGDSARNLAQTSLPRDMVFSDGWSTQLAKVTGSVGSGYVAELSVPV